MRTKLFFLSAFFFRLCLIEGTARTYEIHPAATENGEEFERIANALNPGDELILHGGVYSQTGRRAVTVRGRPDQPIVIRAAMGQAPLLTRPADNMDRFNNIEFVDCAYLIIRGLRFQGGSSGVRFIRGHHITFENCEIFDTGNNALTMNSGDCHAFVIRSNHIHHTGLSTRGPTEGEGMYIGCHDGKCRTTDSLIEGNYIHHTRGTSDGGNDGIEIKFGSHGNVVRNNVIHDTNIGSQYPGIFVYGGGPGMNLIEGNVIWRAGEGIQVVSDALVRNNIIFDCSTTGITAAPHAAVPQLRSSATRRSSTTRLLTSRSASALGGPTRRTWCLRITLFIATGGSRFVRTSWVLLYCATTPFTAAFQASSLTNINGSTVVLPLWCLSTRSAAISGLSRDLRCWAAQMPTTLHHSISILRIEALPLLISLKE